MSIRAWTSRHVVFVAAAEPIVDRLERCHGYQLRADALDTFGWSDELMVGEAWSDLLIYVATLVERGSFALSNERAWLWKHLVKHLQWARLYVQRRRDSARDLTPAAWASLVYLPADSADHRSWDQLFDPLVWSSLTERQQEVVSMVASGTGLHTVAALLGTDRSSVRAALDGCRTKMLGGGLSRSRRGGGKGEGVEREGTWGLGSPPSRCRRPAQSRTMAGQEVRAMQRFVWWDDVRRREVARFDLRLPRPLLDFLREGGSGERCQSEQPRRRHPRLRRRCRASPGSACRCHLECSGDGKQTGPNAGDRASRCFKSWKSQDFHQA